MSSAELKRFVQTLTEGELIELRSYVRLAVIEKNQAHHAEQADRVKHGTFVDQDEVKAQIERQAGPRP